VERLIDARLGQRGKLQVRKREMGRRGGSGASKGEKRGERSCVPALPFVPSPLSCDLGEEKRGTWKGGEGGNNKKSITLLNSPSIREGNKVKEDKGTKEYTPRPTMDDLTGSPITSFSKKEKKVGKGKTGPSAPSRLSQKKEKGKKKKRKGKRGKHRKKTAFCTLS